MSGNGGAEPKTLARRQFEAFNELGRAVEMTDDDRRRLLGMSPMEWSVWETFMSDGGPPPSAQEFQAVLLRVANASYRLAVRVEQVRESGATGSAQVRRTIGRSTVRSEATRQSSRGRATGRGWLCCDRNDTGITPEMIAASGRASVHPVTLVAQAGGIDRDW